ncbi:MAG: hypothetical protein IJQ73_14200 [Kiritimatiellae bacterium]|nr:hypothetical protein [Kiritimatiellia bacterium]
MKRILSALLALSAAMAVADGSPFSVSGSSATFIVDTRPDVFIEDVTSDYCSGRYGGQGGRSATFLAGINCDIDFRIKAGGRNGNPISHYLVNGQRHDSASFTFNVGSLAEYGFLRVVAVDYLGRRSEPFRVNMEIAPLPPIWETTVPGPAIPIPTPGPTHTIILVERHPREHRLVYRALDIDPIQLFDALSDDVEFGDEPWSLSLLPKIDLDQTMDSSTGQFCSGADLGVSFGGKNRFQGSFGTFGMLDLSYVRSGGAAWSYDPRQGIWTFDYGEYRTKFDRSLGVKQRIPDFPLIYAALVMEASKSAVLRYDNANRRWSGNLHLDPLVALRATAGIGADVVLAAEVSGQGGLHLDATVGVSDLGGLHADSSGRVYIKGKFFWRAVLATHERSGVWWEKDFDIFQWNGTWNRQLAREDGVAMLHSPRLAAFASSEGNFTDSGFRPLPRDYGPGTESAETSSATPSARRANLRLALGASGAASPQILMHDGYPTPQPAIAAGTDAAVAYVRDKASRADLDRTMLVVRDEASDGSWGAESAVWDDGTADFQPKLAFLPDGAAVAAWANAKRTFADGTSFETVCSALEIAVGVRNPQSGAWTCANLTDDAALDWVPVLKGATNGTAAVAWVRNAAGAYIGSASQPSDIAVSFYRNGAWSPMAVAVPAAGAILSHDIAWDGDKAALVWAADADGDLMTDDSEIWARSFANGVWSAPVRLSAASASAMRPYAWFLGDGTPHAVWVQDGALFAANGLAASSGAPAAAPEDVSVPSDFRLSVRDDGSATLLWATSPIGSEGGLQGGTMSADYTPEAGLSAPATLFSGQSALMRNLSGAMGGDGTLRVAYESVAVSTNAEGALVYGAVDLAVHRREAVLDVGVAAEGCLFATNVIIGVTNVLRVGIQNFGTSPVRSVVYRVWDGEGADRTLLASGETEVPPLSRVVVEAPWTPSEGLSSVAFTIEVDPDSSIADADRTNNTLLWRPDVGSPAISFRNAVAVRATDNLRLISARIHNDSVAPVPAGMAVKFWRGEIGGSLIGTDTAGLVAGGNAGEYDVGIAWDISREAFTSEWEKVVIELPAELGGRSVSVWTTTPLYVDDDEGGDDPGGGGTGGGNTPSQPPDIVGGVGFAVVEGRTVFNLSFQGEAGFTYLLQYKRTLADPAWTTLQTVSPSATGVIPVAIPILPDTPSAFFRVVVAAGAADTE